MKPTVWALPLLVVGGHVGERGGPASPIPVSRNEKDAPVLTPNTPHGKLSCGTQLGPRPSVRGLRPSAAGNTRRNGPASRGKPTRLRRGLGMLGSSRLQVRSLLASSAAARAAAAGCRLDRSSDRAGPVRAGCSSREPGTRTGERDRVRSPHAALPWFRSAAGGSARGKNSGSRHDSRASESQGGGGGLASGSRAAGSDPSLGGRA